MSTITNKLEEIKSIKASIKNSIENKGVQMTGASFDEYPSKIDSIVSGAASSGHKVVFFDYDGTILKTQYVEDGLSATPPTPPTHENLVFNNWNQSLFSITSDRNVGAIYDTVDGASYFYITLTAGTGLGLPILITKASSTYINVDWGDGTSTDYTTTNAGSHLYPSYGDYIIKVTRTAGTGLLTFGASNSSVIGTTNTTTYRFALRKALIGSYIANVWTSNNKSMQFLSLPEGITTMPYQACVNAEKLNHINIPKSVLTIADEVFGYNKTMQYISFSDTNLTSIGSGVFYYSTGLREIILPFSSAVGGNFLAYCSSLEKIQNLNAAFVQASSLLHNAYYKKDDLVFPNNYSTVGSYSFFNTVISSINVPEGVVTIQASAFHNSGIRNITLPSTLTTLGSGSLRGNYLKTINLPNSLTIIESSALYESWLLEEITIPPLITNLTNGAFRVCPSLDKVIITNTNQVVTLADSTVFANTSALLKFYVPDAFVENYKVATNWVTYAGRIFPISEV